VFVIGTDKAKAKGGRKVGGVGVMKRQRAKVEGNELKLKEIEASRTLGGAGEGRVQGRGSREVERV
jgi:hypothetical protein